METARQANGEKVAPAAEQRRDRRLLIVEGDPSVRDICGKIADELKCDVYLTSYIANIDNIVSKFQPSGILIDLGLFESYALELQELLLNTKPPLKILFLDGEDEELAKSAETQARSSGLNVEGNLERPVTEDRLEHALKRML